MGDSTGGFLTSDFKDASVWHLFRSKCLNSALLKSRFPGLLRLGCGADPVLSPVFPVISFLGATAKDSRAYRNPRRAPEPRFCQIGFFAPPESFKTDDFEFYLSGRW